MLRLLPEDWMSGCNRLGCSDSFFPDGATRGQYQEVEPLLGTRVPGGVLSPQEQQF